MATKAASKRLGKESQMMDKDPPPFCFGRPREDNVLEWHFILRGPPDTPFHGGEYWGQLLFPPEYPFKPPGIKMSTPSGRFYTDQKICTSMSDFHPGSWNPAWSVANILVGLLSFMCADEMTTGSLMASHADRCTLAKRSHAFNIKQPRFKRMFPDYCAEEIRDLPNMGDTTKKGGEGGKPTADASASTAATIASSVHPAMTTATSRIVPGSASPTTTMPYVLRAAPQQPAPPVGVNAQAPPRPRSGKALFPFLIALAAYLFISRLASLSSGDAGGSSIPPSSSS